MTDDLKDYRAPSIWPRLEFLMQLLGAIGGVYLFAVVIFALARVAA